jgi:hypothetical protein
MVADTDKDLREENEDLSRRLSLAVALLERAASIHAKLLDAEDILRAVDHTLTVHGKVDAETPLHKRIAGAISHYP